MFPCRWTSCDLHFDELDALYDHLSESHVGRKISNTLTLTCGWGECRASYNKRDHLTSHLRSHVPLKPHLCPVCSRGFKRPQDLKKHEKLHEPGHVGRGGSITDMAERDCQAGRIGISASEDNPSWQTATQPQSYAQPARKMSRESLAKPYATIKSHPPPEVDISNQFEISVPSNPHYLMRNDSCAAESSPRHDIWKSSQSSMPSHHQANSQSTFDELMQTAKARRYSRYYDSEIESLLENISSIVPESTESPSISSPETSYTPSTVLTSPVRFDLYPSPELSNFNGFLYDLEATLLSPDASNSNAFDKHLNRASDVYYVSSGHTAQPPQMLPLSMMSTHPPAATPINLNVEATSAMSSFLPRVIQNTSTQKRASPPRSSPTKLVQEYPVPPPMRKAISVKDLINSEDEADDAEDLMNLDEGGGGGTASITASVDSRRRKQIACLQMLRRMIGVELDRREFPL